MQRKESSPGSQATQCGYRVERADLIGARRSGGAGVAEVRAGVGTRGVASLSGCSGAGRGIGGRPAVGMGPKKGRMRDRACAVGEGRGASGGSPSRWFGRSPAYRHRTGAPGSSSNLIRRLPRRRLLRLVLHLLFVFDLGKVYPHVNPLRRIFGQREIIL